jgi:hypothetical protein
MLKQKKEKGKHQKNQTSWPRIDRGPKGGLRGNLTIPEETVPTRLNSRIGPSELLANEGGSRMYTEVCTKERQKTPDSVSAVHGMNCDS